MSRLNNILLKIQSREIAAKTVQNWKNGGSEVVFTNGCFDILHKGHVTYLAGAASLGDKLVVALNTDASVKRLGKSPERPVNPEDARLLVLASLEVADLVVLFDEDTPEQVIAELRPDVLVKGADYDADETDPSHPKYIVGSDIVKEFGGRVQTIDLVDGFSTTSIIQKLNGK